MECIEIKKSGYWQAGKPKAKGKYLIAYKSQSASVYYGVANYPTTIFEPNYWERETKLWWHKIEEIR